LPYSSGKRQAASGKRQAASGKRQAASGKRQAASGKRQAASGKSERQRRFNILSTPTSPHYHQLVACSL
jgi:hypothetical protein